MAVPLEKLSLLCNKITKESIDLESLDFDVVLTTFTAEASKCVKMNDHDSMWKFMAISCLFIQKVSNSEVISDSQADQINMFVTGMREIGGSLYGRFTKNFESSMNPFLQELQKKNPIIEAFSLPKTSLSTDVKKILKSIADDDYPFIFLNGLIRQLCSVYDEKSTAVTVMLRKLAAQKETIFNIYLGSLV